MSEDAFRWIVVIGVLLAAMAFILQAAFVYGMYRVAKASEEKLTPLLEAAAPILGTVRRFVDENGPKLSAAIENASETVKTVREQVDRLGEVVKEVGDRARAQIARIDGAVDQTVEQLGNASHTMKSAITRPAREVNGLVNGLRAALSVYAHGRRESVDHATQDEEMFI